MTTTKNCTELGYYKAAVKSHLGRSYTFIVETTEFDAENDIRDIAAKCLFMPFAMIPKPVVKKTNKKILNNPECVKALRNVNWAWVI